MSDPLAMTSRPDDQLESESASEHNSSQSTKSDQSNVVVSPSAGDGRASRKRRRINPLFRPQASVKRLRHHYNDKYRILYNEVISNAVAPASSEDQHLRSTHIGAAFWTKQEKATFFASLSRRGRHNPNRISADIGSKSEPEVCQYLLLLQKAFATANKLKLPYESPEHAAAEISQQCIDELDCCAGALDGLVRRDDEKAERRKHGDLWLLKPRHAQLVDQAAEDTLNDDMSAESRPPASLLNLKKLLHLSKEFFMNSTDLEYNWRTHKCDRIRSPSVMNTTFFDFCRLVQVITRRLARSACFLAMSRIKALEEEPEMLVKEADVAAALQVLGMKPTARTYWADVARRCKLNVVDKIRGQQTYGAYTYDEVEKILDASSIQESTATQPRGRKHGDISDQTLESPSGESTGASSDNEDPEDPSDSESIERLSESIVSTDFTTTDDTSDSSDSASEDSMMLISSPSPDEADRLELQKHERMEAVDQYYSWNEEVRLWGMLRKPIPTHLRAQARVMAIPNVNMNSYFSIDEDWTDWIDYRAEWESFDTPVAATAFRDMARRKKSLTTEGEDDDEWPDIDDGDGENERHGGYDGTQSAHDDSSMWETEEVHSGYSLRSSSDMADGDDRTDAEWETDAD